MTLQATINGISTMVGFFKLCYLNISVSHVRVERIAIDSGSGNIYYTGINSGRFDVENPGFIGVVTPSGEHMTVKDDLIQPMDIVLHGSEG